jgi:SAM-dependent methyltransferase
MPDGPEFSAIDSAPLSFDPTTLADRLILHEPGLWTVQSLSAVSYPDDGGARCRQIEDVSFWFRHRNRCIVALARRFAVGRRVWDVGGGNGVVSHALSAAGFDTALIEPGAEAARNALDRGVPVVIQTTLEDAGFHPHSLTAAGLFDVLEHIEEDGAFLRNLHGVLAPGAPLLLTVPAHRWLWSANDRFGGHFRRYNAASLTAVLAAAGFEVRYLSYFFKPLVVPIFLFRTLPSALGLRREVRQEVTAREHRGRLDRWLAAEERRIAAGKRQAFGASLLAAATAKA